jgi:hypothetical protein
MTKLGCAVAVGVMVCGLGAPLSAAQAVNPDAKLLQEFQDRVKEYVELRKQASKDVPKLKETEDPAKIKAAQDGLAHKIRAARPKARRGDIFTPDIAKLFRRLMYPEVKGPEGKETKDTIKDTEPGAIALKVNARYPEEQPLPTMPANLLASLPKLPEDLEYRVVRNALILRDVRANLIVDFIPAAIR